MVGLFKRVRKIICKHRFAYEDLKLTGIPIEELPTPCLHAPYIDWEYYFSNYVDVERNSEGYKKRVVWPCDKCGKEFYAHCGLDIIGTHGEPFWRKDEDRKT